MSEKNNNTAAVQVTQEVMLPVELESLIHKAFQVQIEYQNESKFVPVFINDAFIMYCKYMANDAVNTWERAIAKCQKLHAEFNREEAIAFLQETRTGAEYEQLAVSGAALKQELS